MGWVSVTILLTVIFTVALNSHHREKALAAREKLLEVEAAYKDHIAEIEADYARDIALLQGANEVLRGEL